MSQENDDIDFLDSLEANPPTPTRPVEGRGDPGSPPRPLHLPKLLEFAGIALISAALTAGLVAWMLGPRDVGPAPGVDAAALGRSFVPKLAHALADGFDAGAEAIRAGKTLGEGNAILKTTFHESRARAFDDHAGKAIREIVPDGQDFKDSASRTAMIDLFAGFAKGLREAR